MTGMGIAILFMLFVGAVVCVSLVISAVVAFGCIPLVHHIRKTPKERRFSGFKKTLIMLSMWVVLSVTVVSLGILGGRALSAMSGGPAPLEDARKLMHLPAEAQVTKVEEGDWAGDFYIEFRLPDTTPPAEWLKQVWELNSSMTKDFSDYEYRSETNSVGIYCDVFAHMSIAYDPATGIYRFEHEFDS